MGYTTDFAGEIELTPALTPDQIAYLSAFNRTRRMARNKSAAAMPDPAREAVGLPLGDDGQYFTGGTGFRGQGEDPSVVESNTPPILQPGLWCQWAPTSDGAAIEWDGGEKFYRYTEWLEYIINHFLKPWGITANGTIDWFGEDREDTGRITVSENKVSTVDGIKADTLATMPAEPDDIDTEDGARAYIEAIRQWREAI